MAWETPIRPSNGGDEDRDRLKFGAGLNLEATVVRVTDRKPSTFGGEVRYVDADTTDGRKVSFGISGWRLEIFEEIGYQPGDGLRVHFEPRENKNGSTYQLPVFEIDRRSARSETPAASKSFTEPPPF